ncbi:MAG: thiamine-phosphate kinase [Bdellovibrio sp.]|nr:thiamine-phosphate kinase [Bdellovibrio sp.]
MKESEIIDLFKMKTGEDVIVGPGDDCAVLPGVSFDQYTVVTTDMLIEGTHFLKDQITAKQLAKKSLAVNLSDIAAMGAQPTYVFLSLALPKEISDQWITEFALAFKNECLRQNITLVGGDTNRSSNLIVVNPVVHGTVLKKHLKTRSGARKGDLICVTGPVGDSRAGLRLLQVQSLTSPGSDSLIKAHFEPTAQLQEGFFLGREAAVTAMMDVSDGVAADLSKLLKSSNCEGSIQLEKIPVSSELKDFCCLTKQNVFEFAALGGEDYVLLLTVNENNFLKLQSDFRSECGKDLICIGKITDGSSSKVSYFLNGQNYLLKNSSFEHFE